MTGAILFPKRLFITFSLFAITLVASMIILHRQQRGTFAQRSILRETPDVDELDYHFMAVNFAVAGKFPYVGYLADTGAFNISYKRGMALGVDSAYLNMFKEAGPVLAFSRLPLYPLLIGMAYKAFGVRLAVLLWFNILLSALSCALLPSVGYQIWGRYGGIAGIAGSTIWLGLDSFPYAQMNVELLGCLLYLILFLLVAGRSKTPGWLYWYATGIVTGLALLTRPTFLPMLPFYFLYLFASERGKGMFGRAILATLLGTAIVLAPWELYISVKKQETLQQRKAWCRKVENQIEPGIFVSPDQLGRDQHQLFIAIRNFVRLIYIYHAGAEKGLLMGDGFLYLNNEYCVHNLADNGAFGWLWKIIPTSYYNTHDQTSNVVVRVYHFYRDNPKYLYLIPAQRMLCSTASPLIFWLTPALLALCLIRARLGPYAPWWLRITLACIAAILIYLGFKAPWPGWLQVLIYVPFYLIGIWCIRDMTYIRVPIVYFLFWLGIFLFLLFIYGDQRFITLSLAVNCLMAPYFFIFILRSGKPIGTTLNKYQPAARISF